MPGENCRTVRPTKSSSEMPRYEPGRAIDHQVAEVDDPTDRVADRLQQDLRIGIRRSRAQQGPVRLDRHE